MILCEKYNPPKIKNVINNFILKFSLKNGFNFKKYKVIGIIKKYKMK